MPHAENPAQGAVMSERRKTGANPGRGPCRLTTPPRGSRLASLIESANAHDHEAADDFNTAASPELRTLFAMKIAHADPERPWNWPVGVVAELRILPMLQVLMGDDKADALFYSEPQLIEHLAREDMERCYRGSTQQQRNGKPVSVRELAIGFMLVAIDEKMFEPNPPKTENALCEAVAKRMGPGISREVVRRVYRQHFKRMWAEFPSERSRLMVLATETLRQAIPRWEGRPEANSVRKPPRDAGRNAQTHSAP